jgi:prefoldin alpha subunit
MALLEAHKVDSVHSSLQSTSMLTFCLDKTLLVPLTSSLYVPGKLASTSHVLVDVGTGFYVEKTTDDALTFYNGKIEELAGNIKELENVVNGKANNLRMIEEVLRQKMLVQQQGQGQQAAGAAAA